MKDSSENRQIGRNGCDAAILFLRIFIGGVMLMHILGNLQDYDIVVKDFPSILGMGSAASLATATMVEGLFAVMIILGFGTRVAAVAMIVAWAAVLVQEAVGGTITSDAAKLHFVYLGIYVTLAVSGGGAYAFNVARISDKMS